MPHDNARHWDTLCLGTVTIATAVLGAIILVLGGSNIAVPTVAADYSVPDVARALLGGAAVSAYLALVGTAGLAIYRVRGRRAARRGLKRRLGYWVYRLFVAEIIALALMLAVNPVYTLAESFRQAEPEKQPPVETTWRADIDNMVSSMSLVRNSFDVPESLMHPSSSINLGGVRGGFMLPTLGVFAYVPSRSEEQSSVGQ